MTSPSPHRPSSNPSGSVPGTSLDHIRSSELPLGDVLGWPWCQSCRPLVQLLMSQHLSVPASMLSIGRGHEHGQAGDGRGDGSAAASVPWTLASPFPDFICVPALVPRSQLVFSSTAPTSPSTPSGATIVPEGPVTFSNAPSSPPTQATSPTGSVLRKTRGVKIACTNCRTANKKCDEGRPCTRCITHGLADSCVSAERKPRKRTAVRQAAAAAITVSATTQVAPLLKAQGEEGFSISGSVPIPIPTVTTATTAVHIAAAGTSYVDDNHEMADAASYSSSFSPTLSAPLADFDLHFDLEMPSASASDESGGGTQHQHQPQSSNYAVHANVWSSYAPGGLHSSSTDQHMHNPSQVTHATWGYGFGLAQPSHHTQFPVSFGSNPRTGHPAHFGSNSGGGGVF